MFAFFESPLFGLIIEAVITVFFTALVLTGNVHFITVLFLVASAVAVGWHFQQYLNERNTRVY